MACYTPLRASRVREADGSYSISFAWRDQASEASILLPCGQCIGCRLERSRQWAVRCMHEAALFDDNCFITLTFSDENLSIDGSLQKSDLQKFFKRLRRYLESGDCKSMFPSIYNRKITYYACGEYGEKFSRPHYHVCIFNLDFPDKRLVSNRGPLYESDLLSSIWSYGRHWIGDVTFESAAYVARYCAKKITGRLADDHYRRVSVSSGEVFDLVPEFNLMSKKPAIGLRWIEKYSSDVSRLDEVIVNGHKCRPARYYDKYLSKNFPDKFDDVMVSREFKRDELSRLNAVDNSPARLDVRRRLKELKFEQMSRDYEFVPYVSSDVISMNDYRNSAVFNVSKSKEEL